MAGCAARDAPTTEARFCFKAGVLSKRRTATTKPVVNLGMLCFHRQVARISVAFRIPRGAAALSN